MSRAVVAGCLYGLAIFALGFVLRTIRELALAPMIGRGTVVFLEVPVILLASWFVAGSLVRRQQVPALPGLRRAGYAQ